MAIHFFQTPDSACALQKNPVSYVSGMLILKPIYSGSGCIVDFEYAFANSGAEHLLGKKASELIDKQLLECFPGVKEAGVFDAYCDIIDTGKGSQFDIFYPHDGVNKYFNIVAEPYDKGIAVTLTDITPLKKTQKDLESSRDELERVKRARSDFLAVINHELRTPLSPIIGVTDLLLESSTDPEMRESLKLIRDAAQHELSLIENILLYLDCHSEFIKPRSEPVDIAYLLELKHSRFQPVARDKGVKFVLDLASDLPEQVYTDTERLKHVLRNLLDNAFKFTDEGSVTLRAEMINQTLSISVIDTGTGISPDNSHILFEEFQQLDLSSIRKYAGLGIGLNICQKILDIMGASLDFDSEEGKGSTFRIQIPVPNSSEQAAPVFERHADAPRLAVLVVDDVPSHQQFLEMVLKRWHHDVWIVSSGKHALRAVDKQKFDIILTDIHMPEMSGLDLCKSIRSRKPTLEQPKIFALSADTREEMRRACHSAGMDGFIAKPCSIIEISRIFEKFRNSLPDEARAHPFAESF